MRRHNLRPKETGRQGIMRACLDLLEAERVRHWRMNSGVTFIVGENGRKRAIRGHEKGTPDILMLPLMPFGRNLYGDDYAVRPVWCEVKRPGEKQTIEQHRFFEEADCNGELCLLITDAQQLADWLRENTVKR